MLYVCVCVLPGTRAAVRSVRCEHALVPAVAGVRPEQVAAAAAARRQHRHRHQAGRRRRCDVHPEAGLRPRSAQPRAVEVLRGHLRRRARGQDQIAQLPSDRDHARQQAPLEEVLGVGQGRLLLEVHFRS